MRVVVVGASITGLAALLAGRGVHCAFDRRVVGLRADRTTRRIVAVDTGDGALGCDAVVLASGSASPALARPLGIRLPIYPLKGYSITVPASAEAPAISIPDFKRKVVYAPLGAMLRIAGMADITGHSRAIDPERLGQLVIEAKTGFPEATTTGYAADPLSAWSGQRPATPKGLPILGPTPYANLFLDVGRGALGWTPALASGHVVADCIAGRAPAVSLDGLTLPGVTQSA